MAPFPAGVLARLGSAGGSAQLGSARLGSAWLGLTRLDSARLVSARLASARLDSARLDSARLGSALLGSAATPTQVAPLLHLWVSFLTKFVFFQVRFCSHARAAKRPCLLLAPGKALYNLSIKV